MNYSQILSKIRACAQECGRDPSTIRLLVVSKNQLVKNVHPFYQEGCRLFAESRLEEALEKMDSLPEDCEWHLIGNLQRKKVSKVIPHFNLIHSVDSLTLAEKIDHVSKEKKVITSILLQVNTSGESSKNGLSPSEWEQVLDRLHLLDHVLIKGLMTMAPHTEDKECISTCFRRLRECRESWRDRMKNPSLFSELSMGMSHDYPLAIREGATLLRIGSLLFR